MLTREFAATLYRADVEGAAQVRLVLEADLLRALAADGSELTLAYDVCEVERGGANGRMWFCRDRERTITLLCAAPEFASALRERAPAPLRAAIERLEHGAARERHKTRTVWWAVLALLLLAATSGYYGLRSAGRAAVDALPTSIDARLGEQAYAQLALQSKVVKQPELDAALRSMLDRLAPPTARSFEYQVHVFDDATPNAFALPGGTLVVYTGLLRTAQTPEQVAGVLAHEIAHVERRHGMRRIAQSLGVVAAFQLILGDVSGLAAVAVSVLQQGAINSYSREQEREADLDGAQRMRSARLSPAALADFLALLERETPSLPGGLSWLGTHPDLAQRVADIRAISPPRGPSTQEPLAIDWAKLQRGLPAVRTTGTPLAASESAR